MHLQNRWKKKQIKEGVIHISADVCQHQWAADVYL